MIGTKLNGRSLRFYGPVLFGIVGASLTIAGPSTGAGKDTISDSVEHVANKGRIDWDHGTLFATGLGAVPNDEANEAKAYLRARGYAKLDALRNMLMVIDHVRIDSQTVGSDYEAKSDEIHAEVQGIIRGASIVSERKIAIGNSAMIEVTVSTPMYGDRGIASAFVPEMERRSQQSGVQDQSSPATVAPSVESILPRVTVAPTQITREPLGTPNLSQPITGLIIDTRGTRLDRSMSPKILRPDGTEVWGTLNVDPDWLIEHGLVSYTHSIADARGLSRAGSNPLVIRAVGVGGGKFYSDAVVSAEDAEAIVKSNADSGYLKQFHVVFVVDSNH